MTPRFPTFGPTPAEKASLEATVLDLLAEGARLLHRPGPLLGRHDYAAALRLVRDATAYSADLLELAEEEGETDEEDVEEDEEESGEGETEEGDDEKKKKKVTKESAYPASCALLKGDALRGLGRFADAADAYCEAANTYDVEEIPPVGPSSSSSSFSRRDGDDDDSDSSDEEEAEPHIDRGAAVLAARHLADLESRRFFPSGPRRRRHRAGGVWNAHDVAGARHRANEDKKEAGRRGREEIMEALRAGGSSGRRAEYWDSEPALVLRSVAQHQPVLTLVDRPAARAAAGAVPAVVVGVVSATGRRVHGPRRAVTSTMIATTTMTTRPLTSGGGGGSWLPSGNPRVAATTAAPRGQEQPPRPLRRRKSTSQDLKALLQAQTGDRHGSSGR